jgi:hypothetical protein
MPHCGLHDLLYSIMYISAYLCRLLCRPVAHTHPSAAVSGRAVKPKGFSLRQSLRSCAKRALAAALRCSHQKTTLSEGLAFKVTEFF